MSIKLPDLVQKFKIDTKDMSLAAQRAQAMGQKFKDMSRDIDESNKRTTKSMDALGKSTERSDEKLVKIRQSFKDFNDESRKMDSSGTTKSMRDLSKSVGDTNKDMERTQPRWERTLADWAVFISGGAGAKRQKYTAYQVRKTDGAIILHPQDKGLEV